MKKKNESSERETETDPGTADKERRGTKLPFSHKGGPCNVHITSQSNTADTTAGGGGSRIAKDPFSLDPCVIINSKRKAGIERYPGRPLTT